MKKRAWFLGSSLLGLALVMGPHAEAADDIVVEGAPAGGVAVEGAGTPGDPTVGTKTAEPEQAKQRGFYAGGGVGGSFWEGEDGAEAFDPAFSIDGIDDENDFLWTVFGGYRIAEWGGLEVGYTDLGGFSVIGRDIGGIPGEIDDGEIEANGIEARVRVWHHLGIPWIHGIGGLGVFIYDTDQQIDCASGGGGIACPPGRGRALLPSEDSGESLTVSAGLQFQVHRNVLIRAEWQRYFDVLDQAVDTVQASVVFGFYDFFGQGEAGGSMGGIVIEE